VLLLLLLSRLVHLHPTALLLPLHAIACLGMYNGGRPPGEGEEQSKGSQ